MRFARKCFFLPVILLVQLLDEIFGQHANVFAAFAQGRQHDRKDEHAMIEILAKRSLANLLLEIAMSSDHHANIDRERLVAANPFDLAFL